MKQTLFTIFAVLFSVQMRAQSLPIENMGERMQTYLKGCLQLNKYIDSKDREDLTAALSILNPIQLEVADFEPEPIDTIGLAPFGYHMRYDYGYALALFNDLIWEDSGLSRGISTCTVKLLALKPNAKVQYKASGCDDFYLFTVAEPHARVKLSVEEVSTGIIHEGIPLEDGTVSFVSWNQDYECDLIISIENTTDTEVSLTLASQGD